jgi:hypothetical protein
MDATVGSIAIVAALFFFVLPIFLLVRSQGLKKKADILDRENNAFRDELRRVVSRVQTLEQALETLRLDPQRASSRGAGAPGDAKVGEPTVVVRTAKAGTSGKAACPREAKITHPPGNRSFAHSTVFCSRTRAKLGRLFSDGDLFANLNEARARPMG